MTRLFAAIPPAGPTPRRWHLPAGAAGLSGFVAEALAIVAGAVAALALLADVIMRIF